MSLPPLIERQLRAALAGDSSFLKTRFGVGALGLALCLLVLLVIQPRDGREVFSVFITIASLIAILAPVPITADLFASERRNQTLGLLFLTGMKGREIFITKLLGATAVAVSRVLALVPMLILPFLIGGVPAQSIPALFCYLPLVLLLTISTGVLASVLARDPIHATAWTVLLLLLIHGSPMMVPLINLIAGTPILPEGWMVLSPSYGAFLLQSNFSSGSAEQFWTGAAFTLGLCAVLLAAAERVLSRNWRDLAAPRVVDRPARARKTQPVERPFMALGERESQKAVFWSWVLLASGSVGTLLASAALTGRWIVPGLILVAVAATAAGVGTFFIHAASRGFGELRATGLLESIVTTPIPVEEMIRDYQHGISAAFRPVFISLACVAICGLIGSVLGAGAFGGDESWTLEQLGSFVMAWVIAPCLTWAYIRPSATAAMWISLVTGQPAYATWRAISPQPKPSWWWWPLGFLWLPVVLFQSFKHLLSFPSGSPGEVAILTLLLLLSLLSVLFLRIDIPHLMREEFRTVATRPLPSRSDPRLSKWDPASPFPWSD
jgi:ABC-type transport system involved in multi-copper enzyme maturation permease subunit